MICEEAVGVFIVSAASACAAVSRPFSPRWWAFVALSTLGAAIVGAF